MTDTPPLDLTPQPVRTRSGRRRWVPMLVFAVVLALAAVLLVRTIGGASLFFYNVDEAVERRSELTDQRFRLQGTPVGGTVLETEVDAQGAVAFTVRYNSVLADVVHVGDPPEMFAPGVPVVLEGRWVQGAPPSGELDGGAADGWYFASDRMLVKHDNEYRNDRIIEAETGGRESVEEDATEEGTTDGYGAP
jgi:cytochrome c-type biogenesis protein CcmE